MMTHWHQKDEAASFTISKLQINYQFSVVFHMKMIITLAYWKNVTDLKDLTCLKVIFKDQSAFPPPPDLIYFTVPKD